MASLTEKIKTYDEAAAILAKMAIEMREKWPKRVILLENTTMIGIRLDRPTAPEKEAPPA